MKNITQNYEIKVTPNPDKPEMNIDDWRWEDEMLRGWEIERMTDEGWWMMDEGRGARDEGWRTKKVKSKKWKEKELKGQSSKKVQGT